MPRILQVVCVVLALGAQAAQAGECGYAQCWGAVGVGPGGAYGYSWGKWSDDEALTAAQRGCGGLCTQIRSFYNTCGAIAVGASGGWGFGWANGLIAAEQNALGFCQQGDLGCQVAVSVCSY